MTEDEKNLLIRIDERLKNFVNRMDDRLENIEESLSRDYKCLHGNGQPGLIQQVQKLEYDCKELREKVDVLEKIPARVQTLENYHSNENKFLRKYGAVIAWIATTALSLYSVIKHH